MLSLRLCFLFILEGTAFAGASYPGATSFAAIDASEAAGLTGALAFVRVMGDGSFHARNYCHGGGLELFNRGLHVMKCSRFDCMVAA